MNVEKWEFSGSRCICNVFNVYLHYFRHIDKAKAVLRNCQSNLTNISPVKQHRQEQSSDVEMQVLFISIFISITLLALLNSREYF